VSPGTIGAILAEVSNWPRYAFLVLQLVSGIADGRGQAGPFVVNSKMSGTRMSGGAEPIVLPDWLCTQLLPMSQQPAACTLLCGRGMQVVYDGQRPLRDQSSWSDM
jgi:hypothetical protein